MDNIFSDPSIKEATKSSVTPMVDSDNYNPFENTTTAGRARDSGFTTATTSSAGGLPSTRVISAKSVSTTQPMSDGGASGLYGQMSDSQRADFSESPVREKNFPPLPSFCPIKPCFYQDIQTEIPMAFQQWCTRGFQLCMFLQLVFYVNLVAAVVTMIADPSTFLTLLLAVMWAFIMGPAAYVTWFRTLYKAFRDDSSLNFMLFFFIFFVHIVFSALMFVGLPSWGFCGLTLTLKMVSRSGFMPKFAGITCMFATLGFFVILAGSVTLLIRVHKIYRSTGASFSRAQQELRTNVMSNRQAQQFAQQAVTSIVIPK